MATPAYSAPFCFQDLNLFAASSGTPTFATSGLRSSGGSAKMVCAAAGAVKRADVALPASTRILVDSFYFEYTTAAPSINGAIWTIINASGNITLVQRTTNQLRFDVGSTTGTSTTAITQNQWYRVDYVITVSGGTTTVNWWLNGVAQTPTAAVQADADLTTLRIGVNTAMTHTVEYMDHLGSFTAADAPLGESRSKLLDLVAAVGANHVLGSGSFQKTTVTAITSGDTNSQAELTEKPFSSAQFVAQTGIDVNAYLVYPLADTAETTAPALVLVGVGYAGSGGNPYTFELRLHDGTSESADLTTGLTKSTATLRYALATLTSAPSGAWTVAKLNASTLRFGRSSDVTPNPRLAGLAVQAVHHLASAAAIGQVTESDTPQAVTHLKRLAAGQVSEADTSQPVSTPTALSATIGQVSESDTPQAVTHLKRLATGQVTEADTAQPVTGRKRVTIGQVSELATAQPVVGLLRHVIGQVAESDTVQAITARYLRGTGQVLETDTAQPVARAKRVSIGQVAELDAAQALTLVKRAAIGLVTESDTAFAFARAKLRAIGRVTESDTAQAVSRFVAPQIVAIGRVTETATAQALTSLKRKLIGQASDTSTAQPATHSKKRGIGQVTELSLPQALVVSRIVPIGLVAESDTVRPLGRLHARSVGQVVEQAIVLALVREKRRLIGLVTEDDIAGALAASRSFVIGRVVEFDAALPFTPAQTYAVLVLSEHAAIVLSMSEQAETSASGSEEAVAVLVLGEQAAAVLSMVESTP